MTRNQKNIKLSNLHKTFLDYSISYSSCGWAYSNTVCLGKMIFPSKTLKTTTGEEIALMPGR